MKPKNGKKHKAPDLTKPTHKPGIVKKKSTVKTYFKKERGY